MNTWNDLHPDLKKIASILKSWPSVADSIYVKWDSFSEICQFCDLGQKSVGGLWYTKEQWELARHLYLEFKTRLKVDDFDYAGSLKNLLAVLHRDGGHYTEEHGIKKSFRDSLAIAAKVVQQRLEWDGKGIPPIGTVCEVRPYWHKVRIVAHDTADGDCHIVFWNYKEREYDYVVNPVVFRPIVEERKQTLPEYDENGWVSMDSGYLPAEGEEVIVAYSYKGSDCGYKLTYIYKGKWKDISTVNYKVTAWKYIDGPKNKE